MSHSMCSSLSDPESFSTFPQEVIPQLLCSFCLEEYKDPKDLNCGHSYCLECLQDYVKSTWGTITGNESGNIANAKIVAGLIKCPECRAETKIPGAGVKDLKTNFTLKNVLEKVAQQRKRQKSIPICVDHEEKQLFYCVTCSKTICRACTVLDHPKPCHEWKKIGDVYIEQRASLGNIANETKETSRRFLNFVRANKSLLVDVHRVAEKAERDISDHFDEINISLQIRKETLIDQVRLIRDSRVHKLEEAQTAATLVITQLHEERQVIKDAEDDGQLHDYVRRFEPLKISLAAFCNAVPPTIQKDMAVLRFLPKKLHHIDAGYLATEQSVALEFCGEFGMGLIWGLGEVGGIAATPDGLIIITETQSKRVSVWEMDQHGQYNLKFYMAHLAPFLQKLLGIQLGSLLRYHLSCPTDIAVTSDGGFVVADGINGAMMFSESGALGKFSVIRNEIAWTSSAPVECIATDSHGRVYICPNSTLIHVYERIPGEKHFRKMYLKTLAVKLKPQKMTTDGKLMIVMVQTEDDELQQLVTLMHTQNVLFVPLDVAHGHQNPTTRNGSIKNKAVIVYDLDKWEVIIVFEVTSDANNICYDVKTGSLFVTTNSGCVDQYSVGMGRFMGCLVKGLDNPRGLAVVTDNKLAVANNATVKLYRIK